MPEPEWVSIAIDAAQFATTVLVGIYVWFSGRDSARASAMKNLETDIDQRLTAIGERIGRIEIADRPGHSTSCLAHTGRMAALEEKVSRSTANSDAIHAHQRIDTVSQELAELRGSLKRIERTLDQISDHLLNHPGHL